jgi:hypothetical protein
MDTRKSLHDAALVLETCATVASLRAQAAKLDLTLLQYSESLSARIEWRKVYSTVEYVRSHKTIARCGSLPRKLFLPSLHSTQRQGRLAQFLRNDAACVAF